MLYRDTPGEGDWINLPGVPGTNLDLVDLELGRDTNVYISQKIAQPESNGNNRARATICVPTRNLDFKVEHKRTPDGKDPEITHPSAAITILPKDAPSFADTSDIRDLDHAHNGQFILPAPYTSGWVQSFPLSQQRDHFHEILLLIYNVRHNKTGYPFDFDNARHFLAGGTQTSAQSDESLFITQQNEAVEAESKHAEERLKLFEGCKVNILPYRTEGILLECWPNVRPEDTATIDGAYGHSLLQKEQDVKAEEIGRNYTISDSQVFTKEKCKLHVWHREFDPESETFMGQVIKNIGSKAPITLLLVNYLFPKSRQAFLDVKQVLNVKLKVIYFDPTSDVSSGAIYKLRSDYSELQMRAMMAGSSYAADIKQPLNAEHLPVKALFLKSLRGPANENCVPLFDNPADRIMDPALNLNPSQEACCQAFFDYSVSVIKGPPATGKSKTTSAIIAHMVQKLPHSRMMCCAPTNVAVNELMKKIVSVFTRLGLSTNGILRWEGEDSIRSQYASGDFANVEEPAHIQAVRLQQARMPAYKGRFDAFVKGEQTLRTEGMILNPLDLQQYETARKTLDKGILKKRSIAFVTLITSHVKALKTFGPNILYY